MRISDWSSDVCSSDLIGCDLLALRPPNKRSSPGFRRHFDYRLVEQERTGPLSHASLIVGVTKLGVGGVKDHQSTGDRQTCQDPEKAIRLPNKHNAIVNHATPRHVDQQNDVMGKGCLGKEN